MEKFMYKVMTNDRGSENITRVISYLAFFVILAFVLDLVMLGMTISMVGYQTIYLSKKLSVQGGMIGNTKPVGSSWMTNREIESYISRTFRYVAVGSNDWQLRVDNKLLYNWGYSMPQLETYVSPTRNMARNDKWGYSSGYGQVSNIQIDFLFRWRFSGRVIPGSFNPVLSTSANWRSEFFRP